MLSLGVHISLSTMRFMIMASEDHETLKTETPEPKAYHIMCQT